MKNNTFFPPSSNHDNNESDVPKDMEPQHHLTQHPSRFGLLLIKPSRYDDDGYVVQWWKSIVPAHSLAAVWGIVEDAAAREILGPNVTIEITGLNEITTRIDTKKLTKKLKSYDRALVMMIGVQTCQYPRSVDMAREFIAEGIPVAIGGFHISGTMALTPNWEHGAIQSSQDEGISLYAGELEAGVDEVLRDAWAGKLKPLYDKRNDLADMSKAPIPKLLTPGQRKMNIDVAGMDMGRGCPFKCSFCSVINVSGNKMRARSPEDVEAYLRLCIKQGTQRLLLVDDNFARLKEWEDILDVFIKLHKETGIEWDFFMQLDTQSHRIPGFVEKARAAGCTRVFIGIEAVRTDNLLSAGKKHNRVQEMHDMAMSWKKAGIFIFGTLIVGFEHDTPERMKEDITFIQDNVPIDILITTVLTPLPGSMDHKHAVEKGIKLDPDLNEYDTTHAVIDHPLMSKEEWNQTYLDLYDWYYTPEHIEKIFTLALENGISVKELSQVILGFYGSPRFEKSHPYVYGLVRRKSRIDRRPGFPLEPIWRFYPRRIWEVTKSLVGHLGLFIQLRTIEGRAKRALKRNPRRVEQV